MNILLTNDDGINALGINTLFDVLSKEHTVYLFAPNQERSACSNALTIHNTIQVDFQGERRFAVHGFPADCVNIGLYSDLGVEIDLIVSGINHGPNLGDDIHYSGTVAGARTAYIFGKNSIAVSLDNTSPSPLQLQKCSEYIAQFINTSELIKGKDSFFVNVNYPDIDELDIKGEKIVTLGRRHYLDSYEAQERTKTHVIYKLSGSIESIDQKNSDVTEIKNGFITITPLTLDSTDYSCIPAHTL